MFPETETQIHPKVEQGDASPAPPDEPPKTHTLSSLGRQSSIYSLTLHELQDTLSENGKNFGSMNMDEFLSNIWTVEHNQVTNGDKGNEEGLNNQNKPKPLHIQPSIPRQGSLTLPAPLCRKTVDEVWSEINQEQNLCHQPQQNLRDDHHQPAFGEMTLEDFLIKAGVVRKSCRPSSLCQQAQMPPDQSVQHYGLYQSTNSVDPNFGRRPVGPVISMGFSDHQDVENDVASDFPAYQTCPLTDVVAGESSSIFAENGQGKAVCFDGPVAGNGSGYGSGQPPKIGSSEGPVSADGMNSIPVGNSGGEHDINMGGPRGKKKTVDHLSEKVLERRQKRMIRNRESAARSRARKQAQTAELEAEFNRLTEANAQIERDTAEVYERIKKRDLERLKRYRERVPETKAGETAKKLKKLRRTTSL